MKRTVIAPGILLSLLTLVSPPLAARADAFQFQTQTLASFDTQDVVHDFEPAIKVGAPADTVYVAANYHPVGTATHGVELWAGSFGQTLAADGPLNPPLGGLDVDIALGSTGNLYDATEFSPTPHAKTGAYGIGVGTCPAGSIPTAMAAQCYGQQRDTLTHTDRPWIAADGPTTVYLSYHRSFDAQLIPIQRSTDAGRTWTTVGDAIAPSLRHQATDNNLHGPIVVDPASHTVYQVFVTGPQGTKGQGNPLSYVYMGVSHDGGNTFIDHLVYQSPTGAQLGNFWPVAAVDAGGTIYAGWSDGHDVWVSASLDQGVTWQAPLQVSQDSAALHSSVEPWLAGGAAGHVAVVWYGSSATNNMDSSATWNVYYAGVQASASGSSVLFQSIASPHSILTGALCTRGDDCPAGTRILFDDFGVALSSKGQAAIAYGDASDPDNPYRIDVTTEMAGPTL